MRKIFLLHSPAERKFGANNSTSLNSENSLDIRNEGKERGHMKRFPLLNKLLLFSLITAAAPVYATPIDWNFFGTTIPGIATSTYNGKDIDYGGPDGRLPLAC